jgi:hypothetical protein
MKMIIWRLAMSQNTQTDEDTSRPVINNRIVSGCLAKLAKNATLILVLLIVGFGLFPWQGLQFTKSALMREVCT